MNEVLFGLRPQNGWEALDKTISSVSGWFISSNRENADFEGQRVQRRSGRIYLLSYIQARTLGYDEAQANDYNRYLAKEVCSALSAEELQRKEKCYLWLDKFGRLMGVENQQTWNGLTTAIYSKNPILVVCPCITATKEQEEALSVLEKEKGCTYGKESLNVRAFFRGWPWLERIFAFSQSSNNLLISPLSIQLLECELEVLSASMKILDILANNSMSRRNLSNDFTRQIVCNALESLTWMDQNSWDNRDDHLSPLISYSAWYSDTVGVPDDNMAVFHYSMLLKAVKDHNHDLTITKPLHDVLETHIWTGPLGKSIMFDQFSWLTVLMTRCDLSSETWENECFHNPEKWLQKCFTKYSKTVARRIMESNFGPNTIRLRLPGCFSACSNVLDLTIESIVNLFGSGLNEHEESLGNEYTDVSVKGKTQTVTPSDSTCISGIFSVFTSHKPDKQAVEEAMCKMPGAVDFLREAGTDVFSNLMWSAHRIFENGLETCRVCGQKSHDHKIYLIGWYISEHYNMPSCKMGVISLKGFACVVFAEVQILPWEHPLSRQKPFGFRHLNLGISQWLGQGDIGVLSCAESKPSETGFGFPALAPHPPVLVPQSRLPKTLERKGNE